jgi:hypothetical protein
MLGVSYVHTFFIAVAIKLPLLKIVSNLSGIKTHLLNSVKLSVSYHPLSY